MDIPFLQSLREHWRQAPAIRRVVAWAAGYEPPDNEPVGMSEAQLNAYMAHTGIAPKKAPKNEG